ncbi:MAG: heavy metal translocating P-type ATPase, partial [Selenomonadaceae bacterium]
MERKNDVELYVRGLDCANCGLKIEAAARAVEGVSAAQLDFVGRKLHVKIDGSGDIQQITATIARLAAGIEHGVEIVATAEAAATEAEPQPVLVWGRLGLAALFFCVAQLGELTIALQKGLFLAAYLLAGAWVLWGAAKNIFHGRIFDENFLMSIATLGALAIGEFPEAVAVMLFYEIGEILQSAAVGRSRRSIEALLKIR